MTEGYHQPVLLAEVVEALKPQAGKWYVDATFGGGGHTEALLKAGAKVLGLDQDAEAMDQGEQRLADWIKTGDLRLARANFRTIRTEVEEQRIGLVQGILFDLGVSSHQLDDLPRGFSFQSENLDMRMDQRQPITAASLVAQLSVADMTQLFEDWGEERYARQFAQAIAKARLELPISSGKQLAEIIAAAAPPAYRYGRIHPATRVFQALRLAVNDELMSLEEGLAGGVAVLAPQGRIAVISFHSLEDRVVKRSFKELPVMPITKKPQLPTSSEVMLNPRARSAKLRVAEKMETTNG